MSGGRIRSGFTPNDWVLERTETPYTGAFRLVRQHVRHRRFDGGWTPIVTREVFITGDAVTVLPYDPVLDRVLLIEQFRAPATERDASPWLIEVIAGRLDGGESPRDTVARETREESGLALGEVEEIARFFPTPGFAAEMQYLYCARADLSDAGGVHGLDDEDEDIRVFTLDFAQAMAALDAGEIATGPAVTSLLWLALNRERLRARWS